MRKKNIKENYVKRVYPYFKKHKKDVWVFTVGYLIISILSTIVPAFSGNSLSALTEANIKMAFILIIIIFILELINVVIQKYADTSYVKMQNNIVNDIRMDISNSIIELELKDLNTKSSGIFIDRINKDPSQIIHSFNSLRFNVTNGITTIGVIFYIMYLSPIIGILLLIMQGVVYYIEKVSMKAFIRNKKKVNKNNEKQMGLVNESIRGIKDIKLLGLKSNFKSTIKVNLQKIYNSSLKLNKEDIVYERWRNIVISLSLTVIYSLGLFLVYKDIIDLSVLIIIFMYRDRVFNFVLNLAWSERNIREFSVSAKRIFDIIDGKGFNEERFGIKHIDKMSGNIEFKKVSFAYEDNIEVLHNLSFKIKENDTIAIVGRSGSGKTTIFNLLTKAFSVKAGQILFDGISINDLDEETLRKNISIISQNPYVFNMSIKENLKLVKKNATDEEIKNVCKVAELDKFIKTLPQKYDTLIGEGGINLSGGQKQRLAIARALLKDTEIILFDEATSALDNETQASIQKSINNISKDYTIIIIAHRLSTIKDCNKIFVIDNGKKVGEGTHQELLKTNKVYKELYKTEFEIK
ncbi:MAG: ABC transporter ATP-binding protein [Bacilli bacterium]|nr:ABC transporter ATP-binding protein [Bacilli bacterium]